MLSYHAVQVRSTTFSVAKWVARDGSTVHYDGLSLDRDWWCPQGRDPFDGAAVVEKVQQSANPAAGEHYQLLVRSLRAV